MSGGLGPFTVPVCLGLGPFTVPVDEEVESQHLKFVQNPPGSMTFAEAVSRFNSNVSYSGLLHAVTADVSHRRPRGSLAFPVKSCILSCAMKSCIFLLVLSSPVVL